MRTTQPRRRRIRIHTFGWAALAVLAAGGAASAGQTFVVNEGGSPTLAEAIAIANAGDTILIGPGTFNVSPIFLDRGVTIVGAGAEQTTIAGDGTGPVITFSALPDASPNHRHLTLRDLEITGGSSANGGGIQVNNGSLDISNSTISSNSADEGGGLWNSATGTLTIRGSTVSNNTAAEEGGGIYSGGGLFVSNSTVLDNTIGGDGRGGGILSSGGTVVVSNSTITGNTAGPNSGGGGIFISGDANGSIINSIIANNAAGPAGGGGGIFNDGILTIAGVTIDGNSAGDGLDAQPNGGSGGGIFNGGGGILDLSNSLVADNRAGDGIAPSGVGFPGDGGNGGGIFNQGAVTITNSTITGNRAGDGAAGLPFGGFGGSGGGIDSTNAGPFDINASTITRNSAGSGPGGDGFGGGAHNNSGNLNLRPYNSIIHGNTVGPTGGGPDMAGSFAGRGHNIYGDNGFFQDAGDTTGNQVGVDPLLGLLNDNGGPTLTISIDPNSPARDAGDPEFSGLPIDQRFFARSDMRIDIGAFELNSSPSNLDFDGDGLGPADEILSGTDPFKVDTDGDGIHDGWEENNGANPLDPTDGVRDVDFDGRNGFGEFIFDLNPNAADPFQFTFTFDPVSNTIEVTLPETSPNREYNLSQFNLSSPGPMNPPTGWQFGGGELIFMEDVPLGATTETWSVEARVSGVAPRIAAP